MPVLLPNEKIVMQSSDGSVTLTTHRICHEYNEWGRSHNQSIMLEHITSCGNDYSAQVWLLIASGLFLIGGLFAATNNNTEVFGTATLVALALGLLYWFTRRNVVTVSSPSAKIRIKVTGMKREQVLRFVNKIEQTKHERAILLSNKSN